MTFKSFKDIQTEKDNKINKTPQTVTKQDMQPRQVNKLPILYVTKDKKTGQVIPATVKFLHGLDKAVDLAVHQEYNQEERQSNNYICEQHFQNTCSFCKTGNRAKSVRCFATYVVSLIGKEWAFEDPVTKEIKSGPYNLTRLAMLPLGRENINVESLVNAEREKILLNRIWLLTKTQKLIKFKGKESMCWVNNPPRIIYEDEYESIMKSEYPSKITLPEKAQQIQKMSKDEVFSLILSTFDNGPAFLNRINEEDKRTASSTKVSVKTIMEEPIDDVDMF